jgi:hypothetical protein
MARDRALWPLEQRTLVSADAVGTPQDYRAPGERLGTSPLLRLTPPQRPLAVEPDHLLVGHGHPLATRRCSPALTVSRA